MGRIKAIITDFDGTLVDTFYSNYHAYKEAYKYHGFELTEEQYRNCYGLRFNEFCDKMNFPNDYRNSLKSLKKRIYPNYFGYAKLNEILIKFIIFAKKQGLKTCIASTASKENLYNMLRYFNIEEYFDIIITGENVLHGKPNPEVYNKALTMLDCDSDEVIVFEDSDVGCEAAENAGINYVKIFNF